MTLLQFAGALIPVTLPSLPAAATTTEPAPTAASIALCRVWLHATPALPPAPIRMTLAGFALAGTGVSGGTGAVVTVKPADHRIASATSDMAPPQRPSARTGNILTFQPMPAIPAALLAVAAT